MFADGQEKSRERSTSPTRSAGIATAVELSLPLSPGRGTVKPKRRKHLLIMGADGAEVSQLSYSYSSYSYSYTEGVLFFVSVTPDLCTRTL